MCVCVRNTELLLKNILQRIVNLKFESIALNTYWNLRLFEVESRDANGQAILIEV